MVDAPDNFVIRDALLRCEEIVAAHDKIMCSVSGGSDSDVMVDMLIRCGAKEKTAFVFFNTGLEYKATFEHLSFLEQKYGIEIIRVKAYKSIPNSVKEYGVPFWSKYVSDMIFRLQSHGFKFEDEPFDTLIIKYPKCKTALSWWCNIGKGTHMYTIDRAPFLKEFMVSTPPAFKISDKCCTYAKKYVSKNFIKSGGYDLHCIGVRRAEEGIRSATYKTCYSPSEQSCAQFRPVFWLRDSDKSEYCRYYNIEHSKCYTQYGLHRTGCFGCPFGKRFEEELASIQQYEPHLLRAADNIFHDSYEYTRRYLQFREEHKNQTKENT